MTDSARRALAGLSAQWGVPCSEDQGEALRRYMALLLRWNARINLTGATSAEVLVEEHLPDAFALASVLPGPARVVDVGSGGGLPAVPLALLRPELSLWLFEPIAKKVAFLRTAVRELGLSGRVAIEARRAEAGGVGGEAAFDAALSRATLAPPAWLQLGASLVRPGGQVFVLASEDAELASPGVQKVGGRSYRGGRRWVLVFRRL